MSNDETIKTLPEKYYPNRCGVVVGGLSTELLREIILGELTPEAKKMLLRLFEFTLSGMELVVVDGVKGDDQL